MAINQQEIAIAAGHYTSQPQMDPYLNHPAHALRNDLDIFGTRIALPIPQQNYLETGQDQAGEMAVAASCTPKSLMQRQAAAKELAALYQWRQQLQAFGMDKTDYNRHQDKLAGHGSQEKIPLLTQRTGSGCGWYIQPLLNAPLFIPRRYCPTAGLLRSISVFLAVSSRLE